MCVCVLHDFYLVFLLVSCVCVYVYERVLHVDLCLKFVKMYTDGITFLSLSEGESIFFCWCILPFTELWNLFGEIIEHWEFENFA